jgi:hypothetical protein
MTLHNYIRRRSHDDVLFVEFDRNLNFIPSDILYDIVAYSGNHGNSSLCWMNIVRDRITNNLIK